MFIILLSVLYDLVLVMKYEAGNIPTGRNVIHIPLGYNVAALYIFSLGGPRYETRDLASHLFHHRIWSLPPTRTDILPSDQILASSTNREF